jgi:hypothetical protein
VIIRNFDCETQQQTVWKSVENQDDLHATKMVQSAVSRIERPLVPTPGLSSRA